MNKLFGLLKKLKKKNKEIKKEIYTNKNIILKLVNKIKEVYKDCIYIIYSEELPLEYFRFETNDEDIGYCGTLELQIYAKKLLIISARHTIKFCKDGVFIDGHFLFFKNTLETLSLSEDEIVKIIKTLNYMLENKQIILESLEVYFSKTLNDKITTYSKEIDTLEEKLNFIKNINI